MVYRVSITIHKTLLFCIIKYKKVVAKKNKTTRIMFVTLICHLTDESVHRMKLVSQMICIVHIFLVCKIMHFVIAKIHGVSVAYTPHLCWNKSNGM